MGLVEVDVRLQFVWRLTCVLGLVVIVLMKAGTSPVSRLLYSCSVCNLLNPKKFGIEPDRPAFVMERLCRLVRAPMAVGILVEWVHEFA